MEHSSVVSHLETLTAKKDIGSPDSENVIKNNAGVLCSGESDTDPFRSQNLLRIKYYLLKLKSRP